MSGNNHASVASCLIDHSDDNAAALTCVAQTLAEDQRQTSERITSLQFGLDSFFLIYAASLMFLMQAGFAMICAGSVRQKNVQNTMMKNLLDACGSALAFFAVGYAFAYGGTNGVILEEDLARTGSTFIGTSNFFLMDIPNYSFWLYQFAFAATSSTIVAGTLAERSQMIAYFAYSMILSAFVFPVIAHSFWSIEGIFNCFKADRFLDTGVVDFAGAGVVHATGGMTALIASYILGPRRDRFHDERGNPLEKPKAIQGYSVSLTVLGTFLLWFGWYGFNAGSIQFISTRDFGEIASHSCVTTTLGAAAGCVTALLANGYWSKRQTGELTLDVTCALNGCLSGLVGITGGCSVMEPWAAVFVGSIAGIIYLVSSSLLIKWRIDDAVDAIPVHLFNGIWGVVSVGLVASPPLMEAVYGSDEHVGWFYSWGRGSGDATLLGANIVGVIFILSFTTAIMMPFFLFLNYMGWFRSDPLEEIVGLDVRYSGAADGAAEVVTQEHISALKASMRIRYSDADQMEETKAEEDSNESDRCPGPADVEHLDDTGSGTAALDTPASVMTIETC